MWLVTLKNIYWSMQIKFLLADLLHSDPWPFSPCYLTFSDLWRRLLSFLASSFFNLTFSYTLFDHLWPSLLWPCRTFSCQTFSCRTFFEVRKNVWEDKGGEGQSVPENVGEDQRCSQKARECQRSSDKVKEDCNLLFNKQGRGKSMMQRGKWERIHFGSSA